MLMLLTRRPCRTRRVNRVASFSESRRLHHPALRTRHLPVDWRATNCRSERPRRSRELNARRTLIYKRRSFPHLWCHPPFRYRGFDESLIWLAILFLERRFRDFERFGNIDVLDPLSRIKGRSAVFEIPKETVLRIFCLAGKIKKAGRRLFAFVGGRRHEKKKVSRRVFEKVDAVREQLHRADDAGSGKLDPEVSEVQD